MPSGRGFMANRQSERNTRYASFCKTCEKLLDVPIGSKSPPLELVPPIVSTLSCEGTRGSDDEHTEIIDGGAPPLL